MPVSGQNYSTLVVPLVAPIIALILAGIVRYALKRINLARILYVDVHYRLRFETSAVYRLINQLDQLRIWADNYPNASPPFITMMKEDHLVLPSIQGELKSCLWGHEVDAVRIFYRDFQRIEHRAGKIEELYTDLVKKYGECPSPTIRASYAKCYFKQIDDQSKIIRETVQFWIKTLCYSGFTFSALVDYRFMTDTESVEQSRLSEAARHLIYHRFSWYLTFIVIPSLAIALAFIGAWLLIVSDYYRNLPELITKYPCQTLVVALFAFAIFVVLPICLKKRGDGLIKDNVLRAFARHKHDDLTEIQTSLTQQSS